MSAKSSSAPRDETARLARSIDHQANPTDQFIARSLEANHVSKCEPVIDALRADVSTDAVGIDITSNSLLRLVAGSAGVSFV